MTGFIKEKFASERKHMAMREDRAKREWAETCEIHSELEIKRLDRDIRNARMAVAIAGSLDEKLARIAQLKNLINERSQVRLNILAEIDSNLGDLSRSIRRDRGEIEMNRNLIKFSQIIGEDQPK